MVKYKKKILFFIFDLGNGGAEKVLVQLVNSLDPSKYDITVQTLFNHGVNKDDLSSHIHRKWLFNKLFNGTKYLVRLFPPVVLHKLLVRENYDYEVAFLEGIPTRIISGCRNKQTKKFAWVHIQMENVRSFFNTYISISEAQTCYDKFDKIAFVSEVARKSFLEKTNWSHLKTGIVHNTLNIGEIINQSKESIQIKLNPETVNLCSVGRLARQKGYPRLIKILGELYKDNIVGWHLYLLGQGELKGEIESLIHSYGLNNQVTLLGYDKNPYKYVSKMDFFVCSSYKEGYSTAVTESVIVNTPILTTDCAGMKEILGDSGVIVDNSDEALKEGLRKVIECKALRVRCKQATIARSTYFSKERTIREFENFIES